MSAEKGIGELLGLILYGIVRLFKLFYDTIYWIFESLFKMIRKRTQKEKFSDGAVKFGLSLQLKNKGFVNINNPFRGILIVGGAGSGKSESMIKPLLWEAMGKNYCGIIYDF